MRLHHLEATAFGPFVETVRVDFDELSDAGVFLLTGPTGAGKSSVLDAVCFGLYGEVPGDRHTARHLRSDLAAPSVAPRVVLELSVGDRRLRFTRSPRWERPKLRGDGMATVQAHVVVEELVDGAWSGLTNRLDDAGLLVTDLLGMSCDQFTQVALLPQGRFMAFLRARSQERQAVLQQLFRTDRFERVERWLVERRLGLRRTSQVANDTVAGVLNRLQEAAGSAVPAAWDLQELSLPGESGELAAWAAELVDRAASGLADADGASVLARDAESRARETLGCAEQLSALQARGAEARSAVAELESRRELVETGRAAVARHERARPVIGLARRVEAARRQAEELTEASRAQLAAVDVAAQAVGPESLAAAAEEAVAALSRAEDFRPRAAELSRQRAAHTALVGRLAEVEHEVARLADRVASGPDDLARAAAQVEDLRALAAFLPLREQEVERMQVVADAAERLCVVDAELVEARADLATAVRVALDRREAHLDVREARIRGMAAELAGDLATGCSCPVCGSAEHPVPAIAAPGAVGRADEDAARKLLDEAEFEKQLRQARVGELVAESARLGQVVSGTPVTDLRDAVRGARAAEAEARSAAAGLPAAQARAEALRTTLEGDRASLHSRQVTLAELTATRDQAASSMTALQTELDRLLESTGAGSLAELVTIRREQVRRVESARSAVRSAELAQRAHEESTAALLQAVRVAGFDEPEQALAAALPEQTVRELRDDVAAWEAASARAHGVLEDPAVLDAMAQPRPDLTTLRAAVDAAAASHELAVSRADSARHRCDRLESLDAELRSALDEWAPVRAEHAVVAGLAALVEGRSADNPQKIRLSAYVLGERLRQVIEAANERLARMTDQRYALEHTDDKGAGEQRGGLSLRMRDDWSGKTRDPATLSGGETFVVSLALALGLADTVCHEAGGTDITTLFIDEGFGSLDADTLDQVMDTLDSLRDGGRVVGLVSHVPELRTRITTQLEVRQGRAGSTVHRVLRGG